MTWSFLPGHQRVRPEAAPRTDHETTVCAAGATEHLGIGNEGRTHRREEHPGEHPEMANAMIAPNLGTILHEAEVTLEPNECAPKVQCIPTPR